MKRILCPTDFSKNAGNSFKYALGLAKDLGAEIELLYVIPPKYQQIDFEQPSLLELIDEKGTDRVLSHMDEYHRKFEKGNNVQVPVSVVVENGKPASEIIRLSKDYDLVVMGNRGKRTEETQIVGSVALEVLQQANCPVLLIPGAAEYAGINHMLFATSMAEEDVAVIKSFSMFTTAFDTMISLVHVQTEEKDTALEYAAIEVEYNSSGRSQKIGGYTLTHPDIHEALLAFVRLRKVDMLAMRNGSRDLFSRLFGKSLSRDMAALTDKPLLILHE